MAAVGGAAGGATAARGAAASAATAGEGRNGAPGGLKVLPPRAFTILKLEKEKKGGGGAVETGNGM